MADITRDDVLELLSEVKDSVDFSTATDLVGAGIINSFDIFSIVEAVDDRFDIFIPAKDVNPTNFNSAESIYELLVRLEDED